MNAKNEHPQETLVQLSTRAKNRLEAFPTGWFVIAFSDELKPGTILSRKFMGQDLVAYRTESGDAVVSDAFCPHMGAHFGHGGRVEGEEIVCPFHGFAFGPEGQCTRTGYGTAPPRKARLRMWHVREQNGIVLVWHHASFAPPTWEVPVFDDSGYSSLAHHEWHIEANPYDTAENSVDIGHFAAVHGYSDVEMLSPLETDGPFLTVRYAMKRPAGIFGRRGKMRAEFTIIKWGLGFSLVEVSVPEHGLRSRHYVFPTAMDERMLSAKIAIRTKGMEHPESIHPLLRFVPKTILREGVLRASMIGYKHDVSQDFEIWKNKTSIARPALAEGDGPIYAYRKWTEQFDPRNEDASTSYAPATGS